MYSIIVTFCLKSKRSHSVIDPSMLDENSRPDGAALEPELDQTKDDTLELGSPCIVYAKQTNSIQ